MLYPRGQVGSRPQKAWQGALFAGSANRESSLLFAVLKPGLSPRGQTSIRAEGQRHFVSSRGGSDVQSEVRRQNTLLSLRGQILEAGRGIADLICPRGDKQRRGIKFHRSGPDFQTLIQDATENAGLGFAEVSPRGHRPKTRSSVWFCLTVPAGTGRNYAAGPRPIWNRKGPAQRPGLAGFQKLSPRGQLEFFRGGQGSVQNFEFNPAVLGPVLRGVVGHQR